MSRWAAAFLLAVAGAGCIERTEVTASIPFEDDFEREALGEHWFPSGGYWTIHDGKLVTTGGNNAPLFLKARLPDDVVVEVDVTPQTGELDSKVELMTDGRRHQSGYIFVFAGWDNTISTIARLDEHERTRVEKRPVGYASPKTFRWRIEKEGGELRWFIDGQPYLSRTDPKPLEGPGHDRFAFGNWQSHLAFDNLKIWPYDQAPPR